MVPSQILASNQIVTKISQSDKKLAYLAQAHIGTKPNIPIPNTVTHKLNCGIKFSLSFPRPRTVREAYGTGYAPLIKFSLR